MDIWLIQLKINTTPIHEPLTLPPRPGAVREMVTAIIAVLKNAAL